MSIITSALVSTTGLIITSTQRSLARGKHDEKIPSLQKRQEEGPWARRGRGSLHRGGWDGLHGVRLQVCLTIYLSTYLPFYLSTPISIHPSIHLSIHPIYLSIIYLSIIYHLSTYLPFYQ